MGKKGLAVASCILIVTGIAVYIGHAEQFGLTSIELPPELWEIERILKDPELSLVIYVVGIGSGIISYFLLKPKQRSGWGAKIVSFQEEQKLSRLHPFHPKDSEVSRSLERPRHREVRPSSMRTYIEDGVMKYSRHGPIPPNEILRRAESFSAKEAFRELRDSFWESRREYLQKHQPNIYKEIRYWEMHLDEYLVYMAIKWVFDIPYKDHDFWVKRQDSL